MWRSLLTPLVDVSWHSFARVAVLALFFYSHARRSLGPTRASLFMPLIPVMAVSLGVPVLSEVLSLVQVAGILMVSAGMAVRRWRHDRGVLRRNRRVRCAGNDVIILSIVATA
jgi:drug/metabolite transporter (DMT)-like permease